LILPHQSSLSVTLGPLSVTTTVEWGVKADHVEIGGEIAKGSEATRVVAMLDLLRAEKPSLGFARVISAGDFPKAAGLASSAAGFAALAVAARVAGGWARDAKAESVLARQGSGSACRSIQGGVCVWHRGSAADGADSFATQEFSQAHWPELRLLVAMVSREEKEVKSRDGMRSAVETSPYYAAWTADAEAEIPRALEAIKRRDLKAIGELAERNAWRMHASSLAADPPLCYLKPQTLEVIARLATLRREGVPAYFTLDAGPNPVVLTDAAHEAAVEQALVKLGASSVVRCVPGGDAVVRP
jgi:diphosphomevalonate decarboxylase